VQIEHNKDMKNFILYFEYYNKGFIIEFICVRKGYTFGGGWVVGGYL